GVDVTIGRDVLIHPGTQLWGATHIDDDAVIGPDTTLTDMKVGRGAKVIRTHGEKSVIGPNANVGPLPSSVRARTWAKAASLAVSSKLRTRRLAAVLRFRT